MKKTDNVTLERLYLKIISVARKLNKKIQTLECLGNELNERTKKMSETLDQILEKVGEIETVGDSAIVLIKGLKKQLDEVLAGGITPAVQAKYDAVFARLEAQKTEIATALVENTPSEAPVEPAT